MVEIFPKDNSGDARPAQVTRNTFGLVFLEICRNDERVEDGAQKCMDGKPDYENGIFASETRVKRRILHLHALGDANAHERRGDGREMFGEPRHDTLMSRMGFCEDGTEATEENARSFFEKRSEEKSHEYTAYPVRQVGITPVWYLYECGVDARPDSNGRTEAEPNREAFSNNGEKKLSLRLSGVVGVHGRRLLFLLLLLLLLFRFVAAVGGVVVGGDRGLAPRGGNGASVPVSGDAAA